MTGRRLFAAAGRAVALLGLMLCLAVGAAAQTPPPAPPPGMTQQQFDALVAAISQAVVKQLADRGAAAAPAAAALPPAGPAAVQGDDAREESRLVIRRLGIVLGAVPEIGTSIGRAAALLSQGERGFLGFVLVLAIVIGGGLLAEWLVRGALSSTKQRLAGGEPPAASRLAVLALLDAVALAALFGVIHALDALFFAGATPQSRLAGFLMQAVAMWRVMVFLARVLLRPDLPVARIIPVPAEATSALYRTISVAMLVLLAIRAWTLFLLAIQTPIDAVAAAALLNNVMAVAVLLFIVWTTRAHFAAAFSDLVQGRGATAVAKMALARNWAWIATVLIVVMSAAQAFGVISGRLAAGTGVLHTLVVILALICAEFVFRYVVRRANARPAQEDGEAGPLTIELVVRCLRMAVRIAAVVIIVQTWVVDVLALVAQSEWQALTRSSISAGITLFLAFIAWEMVKFATDRYVARHPASSPAPGQDMEEQAPTNASRLRTLMPLLRVAFAIVIVVLAALIVLSELGVNVAPLIAGASVVGLAISFGSQTLVRDIVSGIFYLADDAFRVGEYIDVGKAKGTVEGFTLRSIKMRHQNGQIHTIPFGQLGSITNFSRDWTTVKFNLRLARDTDVELVRKTVKKIGVEMLDDPELKAELIEPLKMQGIADIADNALVVRFKFTCRPGKPTLIQRQAIKRMVATFPGKGIEFAKATVSVTTTGGAIDPAAAAAANAAIATPLPQPG